MDFIVSGRKVKHLRECSPQLSALNREAVPLQTATQSLENELKAEYQEFLQERNRDRGDMTAGQIASLKRSEPGP